MRKKIYFDERRKDNLFGKIIFIDGLSRTGKMFIGKIISALKNVEHLQYLPILEHIPSIYRIKSIDERAAISLTKISLDNFVYDFLLGRNLNLRPSDATSICNSAHYKKYLKRCSEESKESSLERMKKEDRYHLFATHEIFPNAKICFKAFPDLKIIEVLRHPVDVISSWHARGWPWRIGKDPLSFAPALKGKRCAAPWFAYKWIEEYETMSNMDRALKSVHAIVMMCKQSYDRLSEKYKKKIIFLSFEDIVSSPIIEINRICKFLRTRPEEHFKKVLKAERCPRIIDLFEREKKYQNIISNISPGSKKLLRYLIKNYEEDKYGFMK